MNKQKEKNNVYPVGITKEGKWFFFGSRDYSLLPAGVWMNDPDCCPCVLSPSRGDGLLVFRDDKAERIPIDVVFPVLHGENGEDGKPLMSTELPSADSLLSGLDDTAVSKACAMASALYETANRARNLKAEYDLATNKKVRFVIKPALPLDADLCARLALLAGAQSATADAAYEAPKGTPTALTPFGELFLPLEGLVDVEAERTRLGKEIEKITKEIQKSNAKLGNASFVDRAPAAVVEQERARLADWEAKKAQLEAMLAALA